MYFVAEIKSKKREFEIMRVDLHMDKHMGTFARPISYALARNLTHALIERSHDSLFLNRLQGRRELSQRYCD